MYYLSKSRGLWGLSVVLGEGVSQVCSGRRRGYVQSICVLVKPGEGVGQVRSMGCSLQI